MPRPIRRPKKAPIAANAPEQSKLSHSPVREKRPLETSTPLSTPQHEAQERRTSLAASEDEFGFHEIRNLRPTPAAVKPLKPVQRNNNDFIIRPDSAKGEEEESDLSSVESMSDPELARQTEQQQQQQQQQRVKKPLAVLKTDDLMNLLPRPQKRMKRQKQRVEQENESDSNQEDSQSDSEPEYRPKRRTLGKKTTTTTTMTKQRVAKKTTTAAARTRLRKPQPEEEEEQSDADADVSEDGDASNLKLDAQARRKLDQIRAHFAVVDDWKLETETVSSPFYSSS